MKSKTISLIFENSKSKCWFNDIQVYPLVFERDTAFIKKNSKLDDFVVRLIFEIFKLLSNVHLKNRGKILIKLNEIRLFFL